MSKRKASGDSVNSDISAFLYELAEYEKNVSKNIYKHNAYRIAAKTLESHPTRIRSGAEAAKLKGIGKSIAKKIDEYLETGELKKLKNIREDGKSIAIQELTRVSGIGPAKAAELVEEGITTIEQLRQNTHKLTHHQQIGLQYLEDFEQKIPRKEIRKVEHIIRDEVHRLDGDFMITICGSYRRGNSESGDIDVLLTHPGFTSQDKKPKENFLENVVDALTDSNLIIDTISLGNVKFMGVCKVTATARRIDIRLTPHDQYYCAILYFTGSDLFNQQMRAHALSENFTLNEYSVRPIGNTKQPGEPLPVNSEEDIFEYIGYPYKSPEERNL